MLLLSHEDNCLTRWSKRMKILMIWGKTWKPQLLIIKMEAVAFTKTQIVLKINTSQDWCSEFYLEYDYL